MTAAPAAEQPRFHVACDIMVVRSFSSEICEK